MGRFRASRPPQFTKIVKVEEGLDMGPGTSTPDARARKNPKPEAPQQGPSREKGR